MDQQLKERLVGAVVLMVAAVVFIPMLLSGPHEPDRPPPRAAPPPAPAPAGFSSRIVPVAPPDAAPLGTAAGRTPERTVEPARAPIPRPEPTPEPTPESTPEPAPVPGRAPAAVTQPQAPVTASAPRVEPGAQAAVGSRQGWVVQLGSFSSARNAHALRDRLLGSGFTAFAEFSGSGADAVTRVYVGPEPDRERAERHVPKLFEQTRLRGIVVRYPGE